MNYTNAPYWKEVIAALDSNESAKEVVIHRPIDNGPSRSIIDPEYMFTAMAIPAEMLGRESFNQSFAASRMQVRHAERELDKIIGKGKLK